MPHTTGIPSSAALSTNLCAYSGPVSSSALDDENAFSAGLLGCACGGESGRTRAHDEDVEGAESRKLRVDRCSGKRLGRGLARKEKGLRRQSELRAENLYEARSAETALATAHAAPGSAFDAVKRPGADAGADGGAYLALSHSLAPADDAPKGRIALDKFRQLLRLHLARLRPPRDVF